MNPPYDVADVGLFDSSKMNVFSFHRKDIALSDIVESNPSYSGTNSAITLEISLMEISNLKKVLHQYSVMILLCLNVNMVY